MKVLFLTRYPVEGASSRYRVFQYLPHLERLGFEAEVQSFMDARLYRLTMASGHAAAKALGTLGATARRLLALMRWREYDALYLQRELFPFGGPVVERWLQRRGATLLFDYDDALFIKKPSRYNRLATLLRSGDKIRALFRLVDCVVAGNDWLRDAALEAGAKRAVTLEVAEDTARIPMHAPHTNDAPVTIGWLGSPSTVKYLHLIEPVLQRIAAEHPQTRWEIVGGGDFAMKGVPWKLTDWSFEAEAEALARFDIGLMPLPNEDWARGKSGGKARTYMAAGIVPVVAGIGYNTELLTPGKSGFLCETPEDWYQAITRALADPVLRQSVAGAARGEVERRFDPATLAGEMARIIREARDDDL